MANAELRQNPAHAPDPLSAPAFAGRKHATFLALLIERLAPKLLIPACLTALFVAAAWLGLFSALEPIARAGAALFSIALLLFSLWPLKSLRLPSQKEVAQRLDRSRPTAHRPLATLADKPAASSDSTSRALWEAHKKRAELEATKLRAGPADSQLRKLDPFALRVIAPLALVAAGFVAGDERVNRLAVAFDWSSPRIAPIPPRLDAWIDPPAYTGRPPIFLTGAVQIAPGEVIRAPIGSVLTIRSTAIANQAKKPAELAIRHGAGLTVPEAALDEKKPRQPDRAEVTTFRRVMKGDDTVRIIRGEQETARFALGVIPDEAPIVMLNEVKAEAGNSERQTPGGIRIAYELTDDYGIAKAELIMEPASPGMRGARTLVPPPTTTLSLRLGAGEAALPSEDHPWAGETVLVRIRVEDDIGQKAESASRRVTLPRRPFSQPVAKALVEQRKSLVFAPDALEDPRFSFEGLLFAPERFTPKTSEFLPLDMLRSSLRRARSDDALRELVERIYELAMLIENGDMSDAERRLREAEARLRDALEREANPNEIRRLAEELRRAMENFLREFAERSLQNRNNEDRNAPMPERFMTQRDLQDMLKKIEELARKGDTAEAKRLLDELRQMMENLRNAQRMQSDPRMQEMGRMMQEIDRLQREQRDLRDRSFRQGQQGQQQQQQGQQGQRQQGQRQRGQQGQQGEQGEQGEMSLEQMQQALRQRLQQLRDRMNQQGQGEQEGMGDADEGMGDAQGQLGQGRPGDATRGQQRALDGLGRAAEGLAQQLQQQMGEGEGDGEGLGQPGQEQRGRAESRTDPLGRPQPNARRDLEDTSRVQVPDQNGLQGSVSERAERVLRELRRRLGDLERPREEMEYLERLLRQR